MIEKVGIGCPIQYYQSNRPVNNQAKPPVNSMYIDDKMLRGLETLGIYNMNLVNSRENFSHKPAEPIIPMNTKINDIKGEKVYKQNGKLECVVINDGNFETKYFPQKENEELVGWVEVKDSYNGKLLKTQEISGNCFMNITEYPSEEDNVNYTTHYMDGKIEMIRKTIELPDGKTKSYEKFLDGVTPRYNVNIRDEKNNNTLEVDLDAQNNVSRIRTNVKQGNVRYDKNLLLNKGAIIGLKEYKDVTVPNFMEREVLNDPDVIPTEKFDKTEIEKIAKQSGDQQIYSFYGNGNLKELNTPGLRVLFNEDGSQIITEYLGDNIEKNTHHNKDGSTEVDYKNDNITKSIFFSSENKPCWYDVKQDDKLLKSVEFTEEGYLQYIN